MRGHVVFVTTVQLIILASDALVVLSRLYSFCVAMIFPKKPRLGIIDFLISGYCTVLTHYRDYKFQIRSILIDSHDHTLSSFILDWDIKFSGCLGFMKKATVLVPCTGTYSTNFHGCQACTRITLLCFLCQTIYIKCIVSEKD